MKGVLFYPLPVLFLEDNQVYNRGSLKWSSLSSVNTHFTDRGFHRINEAALCADAFESEPSFKLLSLIVASRNSSDCPPLPKITLTKPISFMTCC